MGVGIGAGLLIGSRSISQPLFLFLLLSLLAIVLLMRLLPDASRPAISCLIVGLAAGWLVGQVFGEEPAGQPVFPPDRTVMVEIRSDPKVSWNGTSVRSVWSDDAGKQHELLLMLPIWPGVIRGDVVEVSGSPRLAGDFPSFDVDTAIRLKDASTHNQVRHSMREHSANAMIQYVPGSAGSLTLGLLTGDDSGLSTQERQHLRASGLSHITAVSGWNVSIIVVTIGAFFRAVGARAWYWLVVQLVMVGVYVWIVGLEPPIVRAAIMGAVALTALQFGRPSHIYTHLLLAAGIMAALNPEILESLSFQLSFLSMIGLAVASSLCSGLKGWTAVVVMPVAAATAATIATAPLLAATFGTMPLLSVPANLLAGQLVSLAAFAGMVVVATTWLGPLAEVAGWVAWALSSLILMIAAGISRTPGAYHEFAPLSTAATMTIYAVLGLLAGPFFPDARETGRRILEWADAEQQAAGIVAVCLMAVLFAGVVLT